MPVLKTYSMTDPNLSKLHKKIKNSNCVSGFDGLVDNGGVVDIVGDSILDESVLDNEVSSHDNSAEALPRIISLAKNEAKNKHFHNINYSVELTKRLQKTATFAQPGLLTKVEYYEDEAKTIRVLDVERDYEIESITGKLVKKKTIRKYYNSDGTLNPDHKDIGWYTYTEEESRAATHRRRVNITNKLEADMLNMLKAAAAGDPAVEAANIAAGTAFMSVLAPAINLFHVSGDPQPIKDIVEDTANHAIYTFLLADVGGGVLAHQFISAGVTY